MKYFCNPINFEYQYQFNLDRDGKLSIDREAADPSMVRSKGRYYIFPSMTCGFLYSDDMTEWRFHALKDLPVYDYAPDVRVVGDWLYFCASNHSHGRYYRTKDPFSDEYDFVEGAFGFWDPNLFRDDDGRCYFYWGSSGSQPICGVELDPETMQPIGEKKVLFANCEEEKGFERRIGLWPAGYDADGELFCNQRYGDWPCSLERFRDDPWADPEWMLLSYGKAACASSAEDGKGPEKAVDENIRSWWKAATADPGKWLAIDLGRVCDVLAVQVNFADDALNGEAYPAIAARSRVAAERMVGDASVRRWIDTEHQPTRWKLEISRDGELDLYLDWPGTAAGYVVNWGFAPDKLYHSYMVFEPKVHLGGLVKGQKLWTRVDSFNETGITEGVVQPLR